MKAENDPLLYNNLIVFRDDPGINIDEPLQKIVSAGKTAGVTKKAMRQTWIDFHPI